MLTPMAPDEFARAFRISLRNARVLAARKSVTRSGSANPMPAVAMTPSPPSFATAAARPDSEMATPMPPWMMGVGRIRSPMPRGGKLAVMAFM